SDLFSTSCSPANVLSGAKLSTRLLINRLVRLPSRSRRLSKTSTRLSKKLCSDALRRIPINGLQRRFRLPLHCPEVTRSPPRLLLAKLRLLKWSPPPMSKELCVRSLQLDFWPQSSSVSRLYSPFLVKHVCMQWCHWKNLQRYLPIERERSPKVWATPINPL